MTTQEAMTEIESAEFDAICAFASGTRHLIWILGQQPAFNWLRAEIINPDVYYHVVTRFHELALTAPVDPYYEHQFDIPVAVYLYLISSVEPEVAQQLLDTVIRPGCKEGRNYFWARLIIRRPQAVPLN